MKRGVERAALRAFWRADKFPPSVTFHSNHKLKLVIQVQPWSNALVQNSIRNVALLAAPNVEKSSADVFGAKPATRN
jgi:hypothetical protein